MYFSLSPTYLETKSEEEIEKKVAFTAFAVAIVKLDRYKKRYKEEKNVNYLLLNGSCLYLGAKYQVSN